MFDFHELEAIILKVKREKKDFKCFTLCIRKDESVTLYI